VPQNLQGNSLFSHVFCPLLSPHTANHPSQSVKSGSSVFTNINNFFLKFSIATGFKKRKVKKIEKEKR